MIGNDSQDTNAVSVGLNIYREREFRKCLKDQIFCLVFTFNFIFKILHMLE